MQIKLELEDRIVLFLKHWTLEGRNILHPEVGVDQLCGSVWDAGLRLGWPEGRSQRQSRMKPFRGICALQLPCIPQSRWATPSRGDMEEKAWKGKHKWVWLTGIKIISLSYTKLFNRLSWKSEEFLTCWLVVSRSLIWVKWSGSVFTCKGIGFEM